MVQCTPLIDVKTIMEPLLLASIFRTGEGEEEQNKFENVMNGLISIYLQDAISSKLLESVQLPPDFQDFGDVICLMMELNKVKTLQYVMKGEKPPEELGVDKVLEMVVNLQLISAIAQAFGEQQQTG